MVWLFEGMYVKGSIPINTYFPFILSYFLRKPAMVTCLELPVIKIFYTHCSYEHTCIYCLQLSLNPYYGPVWIHLANN
jgi:hypothetical protein